MAFNFFLPRASACILRLAIGSAGIHRGCARIRNVQNHNLIGQFGGFSTSTGEDINSADQLSDVPDGFPFKIEDKCDESGRVISTLTRHFQGEIIKVVPNYDSYDKQAQEINLNIDIQHKDYKHYLQFFARPDKMDLRSITLRGRAECDASKIFLETRGLNPTILKVLCDYCKQIQEPKSDSESETDDDD